MTRWKGGVAGDEGGWGGRVDGVEGSESGGADEVGLVEGEVRRWCLVDWLLAERVKEVIDAWLRTLMACSSYQLAIDVDTHCHHGPPIHTCATQSTDQLECQVALITAEIAHIHRISSCLLSLHSSTKGCRQREVGHRTGARRKQCVGRTIVVCGGRR